MTTTTTTTTTPAGNVENDIMASVAQATAEPDLLVPAASSSASSPVKTSPVNGSAASQGGLDVPTRATVHLHIPVEAAPIELHQGLREIARNHIRKGAIKFCEKRGHGLMSAGGQVDPRSGKGRRGEWWWNVV